MRGYEGGGGGVGTGGGRFRLGATTPRVERGLGRCVKGDGGREGKNARRKNGEASDAGGCRGPRAVSTTLEPRRPSPATLRLGACTATRLSTTRRVFDTRKRGRTERRPPFRGKGRQQKKKTSDGLRSRDGFYVRPGLTLGISCE